MNNILLPYYHNADVLEYLKSNILNEALPNYFNWLYEAPKYSTYRVNTIATSPAEIMEHIKNLLEESTGNGNTLSIPHIFIHSSLPDVVVLGPTSSSKDTPEEIGHEVIVDDKCGAAVLRGAHVYAPGVIGMTAGIQVGDDVSIWADMEARCKKGFKKIYGGRKVFLGNGVALMARKDLFAEESSPSGVAIRVKSTTSGCTSLPDDNLFLSSSPSLVLLQNLPSVLCGWVLNPQPGELVLDACAAPGNKTTHLAALMKNQGLIVALDRSLSRVNLIKQNCQRMSVMNVKAYVFDSTKAVIDCGDQKISQNPLSGPPPYPPNSFDRVLLDAPCSALGQRPQLANRSSLSQLKSYPPLQRKLFKSAFSLLKEGGYLLYSTCTITLAENEEIVSWALKTYPNLELVRVTPRIEGCGGNGWPVEGLTHEQQAKVLRFGPPSCEVLDGSSPCDRDTVGFFIAFFHKKSDL